MMLESRCWALVLAAFRADILDPRGARGRSTRRGYERVAADLQGGRMHEARGPGDSPRPIPGAARIREDG